ncbi:MAG: sulfatase [Planctomycetes bacterium]|nr:sulfatase [Planctomycetota bacterium]
MSKQMNIILFVMDTQRCKNIGCYGYDRGATPNIDRFAEEGVTFLHHYTPGVWTVPTHVSMFTGRHIYTHRADINNEGLMGKFPSIAGTLNGLGYRTVGFSNNSWVMEWEHGTATDFAEYYHMHDVEYETRLKDPIVPPEEKDEGSLRTVSFVQDWIERNYDGGRPFFMFINCTEPHLRCWAAEPFRSRFLPKGVTQAEAEQVKQDSNAFVRGEFTLSKKEWEILRGLYDGETATLDHRMGMLFDYLRRKEILDDTLFIIVSDHGDTAGEHDNHMGHVPCMIWDTMLHTPLIVRHPKHFAGGKKIKNLVQTTDIFPTITELLNIDDAGLGLQGFSLLGALGDNPTRTFAMSEVEHPVQVFERWWKVVPDFDVRPFCRRWKAYRDGQFKYVWRSDGNDELYDYINNPDEQENAIRQFPEKAAELKQKLEGYLLSLERHDYGDKMRNDKYKKVNLHNYARLKAWGICREIE